MSTVKKEFSKKGVQIAYRLASLFETGGMLYFVFDWLW